MLSNRRKAASQARWETAPRTLIPRGVKVVGAAFILTWLLTVLFWFAVCGGAAYVAWHFISKWW